MSSINPSPVARRTVLVGLASLMTLGPLAWLLRTRAYENVTMTNPITESFPLDLHWPTSEPFLFCAYHVDQYPQGTPELGVPAALLKGRDLGQDFTPKDGFRMYHGEPIPGFPVHPHRGFETVTLIQRGYVDHADSLGAAGRYGEGDVQWMTAGDGVQHSEMFPLLHSNQENPAELFQIWLNLPRKSKRVAPHFKMFWSEQIPRVALNKPGSEVEVVAGSYQGKKGNTPPPDSWASDPANDVTILLIQLTEGGKAELPPAPSGSHRTVYFYEGQRLELNGAELQAKTGYKLKPDQAVTLLGKSGTAKILVLQARPIGEPVVQHGPFVMNTREEIYQAIRDFQQTHFGGWPWAREDMIHGSEIRRFAQYPDGRMDTPPRVS